MAIQRDYLQRIIEEFGQALVRILRRRDKAEYDDLLTHLALACRECAGIEYTLAIELPCERLIEVLQVAQNIRPYRYLMLGDLVQLDGWLLKDQDKPDDALARHVRALWLYLEGAKSPYEDIRLECVEKIAVLIDDLPHRHLPHAVKLRLLEHVEAYGRYAIAEQLLFDLTDTHDQAMIERAKAFYRHILQLPGEALRAGGLTQEEAHRGLVRLEEIMEGWRDPGSDLPG